MQPDLNHSPDSSHPVQEVLHARAASGSEPGERRDPHRVALVVEGGGMRGVVSSGMTAALEQLGLGRCFDLVVGASAGAFANSTCRAEPRRCSQWAPVHEAPGSLRSGA